MTVTIGEVTTFPNPKSNKKQARKILEEAAEVFATWQEFDYVRLVAVDEASRGECDFYDNFKVKCAIEKLTDECADLITATCNLLAAIGVDDMTATMAACVERNEKRGRL